MTIFIGQPQEAGQAGRRSSRAPMSDKKAKAVARQMVRDNVIAPTALQSIHLLATAGAMTTLQIRRAVSVSLRSLQRCHQQHIVDHLIASDILQDVVRLPKMRTLKQLRVWKLGVLGEAIARELERKPTTYEGYAIAQITHDVLVNELALRFVKMGTERGYYVEWRGKHDARVFGKKTVKDGRNKNVTRLIPIAEPDSLVIWRDKQTQKAVQAFIVEFHNERDSTRAGAKVRKYELFNKHQEWQQWHLNKMPVVVAGYRSEAVASGYLRELQHGQKRCQYITPRQIQTWAKSKDSPQFYDLNLSVQQSWVIWSI